MLSRHTHISYHRPYTSAIATSTRPAWRRCQAARSNSKRCHINAWPRTSNRKVSWTPVFSTRLRFTKDAFAYQASIHEAQDEVATSQPIITSTCGKRWLCLSRLEPPCSTSGISRERHVPAALAFFDLVTSASSCLASMWSAKLELMCATEKSASGQDGSGTSTERPRMPSPERAACPMNSMNAVVLLSWIIE